MSKIITIIELLNKIANGEEVPEKIKYDGTIWKYNKVHQDYMDTGATTLLFFKEFIYFNKSWLSEEIKIVEDEETIDIDSIEELHTEVVTTEEILRINELIKAVKQINKKIEEEKNNG